LSQRAKIQNPKSKIQNRKIGAPEPIAALNRVKILETGEPLVDIRDFCPNVRVVESACPYLRRTVAEMLNRAQASLPPGYRLHVGTALRTLSMQKSGWDNFFQKMKEEHPGWPLSALRRATNRYFAPYDQPAPPGHCTGGAVDVALLGPDDQPLDMTSPTEGWEAAYTWSDKISPEAKQNRLMMVNAMLGANFSNCREEFWHYSYGDSAWAVRVGEATCPYGLIEPPVAVEARFEGAFAQAVRQIDTFSWTCRPALVPFSPPPAEKKPPPHAEDEFPSAEYYEEGAAPPVYPDPESSSSDEGNSLRLYLGIFWAEGKTVTVHIEWPEPGDPTEVIRQGLFFGDGKEEWEPVTPEQNSRRFTLTVTPHKPRMFLSLGKPAPPADTATDQRDG